MFSQSAFSLMFDFVTVVASPHVGNLPYLPQVLILRTCTICNISCFSLRLCQGVNLITCVIRNAVPIRFLAAGIGTVFRIRSFRGECRITDRAHHVFPVEIPLVFLQFIVAENTAGVVAAVFLGLDGGIKLLATPETGDLAYS